MSDTDTNIAASLSDLRACLADAVSDPRCSSPAVFYEKAEEAARHWIDEGEGYWVEVRYHIRYHRSGTYSVYHGSARSVLGGSPRDNLQVERGFSGIPKLFFKDSGERDIRSHPSGMAEVTSIEVDTFSIRACQSID